MARRSVKGEGMLKRLMTEERTVESVHLAVDFLQPRGMIGLLDDRQMMQKWTVLYGGTHYAIGYESVVWLMIARIAEDRGEKMLALLAWMSYAAVLERYRITYERAPSCSWMEWKRRYDLAESNIERMVKNGFNRDAFSRETASALCGDRG